MVWNSQLYTWRKIGFHRQRFTETDHPVFKSVSAFASWNDDNKENTIHFNADASNAQLLFRTIHSANQLSIHGAVSSWCEEFGLKPNEREPTSESFKIETLSLNSQARFRNYRMKLIA